MVTLSSITSQFELSPTLAANELAQRRRAEGLPVLHMGFGESPFPVPPRLDKALAEAAGLKQYLPTAGLDSLRAAASAYYADKTGLNTDAFDVIIAPGSKLVLYALQMAVAGDLLLPVPSWVSYEPQARMVGSEVIKLPTTLNDDGYYISPDILKETITKARQQGLNPSKIILNSPSNPTGLCYNEENLKALADVCIAEDILIISDEIYGFVDFEDKPYASIARYAPGQTAITTGLSKHLSLGGWRIGIGFIPKSINGLQEMLCTIASETWSCAPAPIQQASIEAYKGYDDIERHIADCAAIHRLMNTYIAENLRSFDIDVPLPQGAFYTYPNFNRQRDGLMKLDIQTSFDLSAYLGRHFGLITLPGAAFGADSTDLSLRLSGCDYDGRQALSAYQEGTALDNDFVARFAPHVVEAVEAFDSFMATVNQQTAADTAQ